MKVERSLGSVGIPLYQIDFGSCFFTSNSMDVWMRISPPYDGGEDDDDGDDRTLLFAVNLNYGLADAFDVDDLVQPIDAKVVITTSTGIRKGNEDED